MLKMAEQCAFSFDDRSRPSSDPISESQDTGEVYLPIFTIVYIVVSSILESECEMVILVSKQVRYVLVNFFSPAIHYDSKHTERYGRR